MAVLPWPPDSEFVPLTAGGIPYSNPPRALDCSPINNPQIGAGEGGVDIVGTTLLPAVFFAADSTYAYFRFRLRDNPVTPPDTFDNAAWVVLFDTDNNLSNSYEWELALNGGMKEIIIKQNTIPNSPGPGFNDQAEVLVLTISFTDLEMARTVSAGSNVGGDGMDYFLDFGIAISTLQSIMGIDITTPLRFSYLTSQNINNFNKDRICCSVPPPIQGSFGSDCFSDPLTLETICTGKIIDKDNGCPISNAKVEFFDEENNLVFTTTTNSNGIINCLGIEPGIYTVKVTKTCYITNCNCNTIKIKKYNINVFNISLAPDCVCEIKCLIAQIESEIIGEKERVYKLITDFFTSTTPDFNTLCEYIRLLKLLNDSTAELDCCIAKTLKEITPCIEGDCNG